MNCKDAKNINISEYLLNIGISPEFNKGQDFWYCSPFRNEERPSFKVNQVLNTWYDHGAGNGGTIIDLIIILNNTDVSGALEIISKTSEGFIEKPTGIYYSLKTKKNTDNPTLIKSVFPLKYNRHKPTISKLIEYLSDRGINKELSEKYCKAVYFTYKDRIAKQQNDLFAVGFKNDSEAWELRNQYMKTSTSPKDITTIQGNGIETIFIFEGFINFLSCLTKTERIEFKSTVIVLNSLSNLNKAIEKAKTFKRVSLFLDNDTAGKDAALNFINSHPNAKNESEILFPNYNDYNDYLLNKPMK